MCDGNGGACAVDSDTEAEAGAGAGGANRAASTTYSVINIITQTDL